MPIHRQQLKNIIESVRSRFYLNKTDFAFLKTIAKRSRSAIEKKGDTGLLSMVDAGLKQYDEVSTYIKEKEAERAMESAGGNFTLKKRGEKVTK